MDYKTFERKLKLIEEEYGFHRFDMTVSANKIMGKSFLILKDKEGKVKECIFLSEEEEVECQI